MGFLRVFCSKIDSRLLCQKELAKSPVYNNSPGRGGKKDQMEYFVKINPDILKSVDSDKCNVLHLCANFGTLEGTKFLVEIHAFDIFDRSNRYSLNAIQLARKNTNSDQVEYFLQATEPKPVAGFFKKLKNLF